MRCASAAVVVAAVVAAGMCAPAAAFDHQSHAVPGESRAVYEDPPGSKTAVVVLDGSESHSHYFSEGPPVVSGKIVSYVWKDAVTGKKLGGGAKLRRNFPVGTTIVELTVRDQTGDEASATTTVKVVASDRFMPGAMFYFYDKPTTAQSPSSQPRPLFSQWRNRIAIYDHNDLPAEARAMTNGAIRVVTLFMPERDGTYKFTLRHMGGSVRCFVNNKLVARDNTQKEGQGKDLTFAHKTMHGKPLRMEILLTRRYYPTRIVLLNNALKSGKFPATINGVTTAKQLAFEPREVVPIALYGSRASSSLYGGQEYTLRASGLDGAGGVQVVFACKSGGPTRMLDVSSVDADTHTIMGTIPVFPKACPATVSVKTKFKGTSNALDFEFLNSIGPGDEAGGPMQKVQFRQSALKGTGKVAVPTAIAVGPDGRYYIGSLTGLVTVLTVNSRSLKVTASCRSPRVSPKGAILGLAFNPLDDYTETSAILYMSLSVLYFKSKNTGARWDNGQVVAWKSVNDKRCMVFEREVISGLPVSDRDHGVNALAFDTAGRLYVSVGSNTNAGLQDPKFGNLPEGQLSAAILVAEIMKPGFNGKIMYNQYNDVSKAKKISGDVSLYATGVRNSFGLTYHSKFGLYATDNGMNQGFGDTSNTCKASSPTKTTQRDKLLRIQRGQYYGHPNRARGECNFIEAKGALAQMTPATTGVAEYTANTFNGQLRGSLFLTKFAVGGTGLTTYVTLSDDGNKLSSGPTKMYSLSGVGLTVGPRGELVMAQVQQSALRVLQPVAKDVGLSVLSVVPKAGPRRGGNTVRVYGSGFTKEAAVTFGGKACKVAGVEEDGGVLRCVAPPATGAGGADVVVNVKGKASRSYGGEYTYA